MVSCMKCSEELSNQNYLSCDYCKRPMHTNCSELTASEIKCMQLKKRILKFLCGECENDLKITPLTPGIRNNPMFGDDNTSHIATVTQEKTIELTKEVESCKTKIQEVHNDLIILKETNIQLIHMFEKRINCSTVSHIVQTGDDYNNYQKHNDRNNKSASKQPTNQEFSKKGILGTGTSNTPKLKLANPHLGDTELESLTWLYLANLDISVTAQDILDGIEDQYKFQCRCIQLKSKFRTPRSAIFKLGVPPSLEQHFLAENYWPRGLYVDKYRSKQNNTFRNIQNTAPRQPHSKFTSEKHYTSRSQQNNYNQGRRYENTNKAYSSHNTNFRIPQSKSSRY